MKESSPVVVVVGDAGALAVAAADLIVSDLTSAIEARGRASLVLAGGSTPVATYSEMAQRALDWGRVEFFWSDERCVGADDPGSNVGMAEQALLEPAVVPRANIHAIDGTAGPEQAAADYERRLRSLYPDRSWPAFDVTILGIGSDGHTASLFPGHRSARDAWVSPAEGPAPWRQRVTLTFDALASSRHVLFLASGRAKADVVGRLLDGREDLPAGTLSRASPRATWLLDETAASRLSFRPDGRTSG